MTLTTELSICELLSRQRFPRTYSEMSIETLFPIVMQPAG